MSIDSTVLCDDLGQLRAWPSDALTGLHSRLGNSFSPAEIHTGEGPHLMVLSRAYDMIREYAAGQWLQIRGQADPRNAKDYILFGAGAPGRTAAVRWSAPVPGTWAGRSADRDFIKTSRTVNLIVTAGHSSRNNNYLKRWFLGSPKVTVSSNQKEIPTFSRKHFPRLFKKGLQKMVRARCENIL